MVKGSSPCGAEEAESAPGQRRGRGQRKPRPAPTPPTRSPAPAPGGAGSPGKDAVRGRRARVQGWASPSRDPAVRPSQPRALRDSAGAMGTPRVVPGPALGRLLLLLSVLAPGRASPRLLDFPAPVCAQEVRQKPGGAGMLGPSGVAETAAVGRAVGSAKSCRRC